MSTPNELWAAGGAQQPSAFAEWGNVVSDVATTLAEDVTDLQDLNIPRFFEAYVDPRDHGAMGDGVTNDTTAFQVACATAVAAGVPVRVFPGTYMLLEASIPANARIEGSGIETVIKRISSASSSCALRLAGSNIHLSYFTVDGNGSGLGAANSGAIAMQVNGGSDHWLDHLWVQNTYAHGFISGLMDHGLHITNCTFTGIGQGASGSAAIIVQGHAIGPDDPYNVEIANNDITIDPTDTAGYGMVVRGADDNVSAILSDVSIHHNRVELPAASTGIAIESWSEHAEIANNRTKYGVMGISCINSYCDIHHNDVLVNAASGHLGIEAVGPHSRTTHNTVTGGETSIVCWSAGVKSKYNDNICIGFLTNGIHIEADNCQANNNQMWGSSTALFGISFFYAAAAIVNPQAVGNSIEMNNVAAVGLRTTAAAEITFTNNRVRGANVGIEASGTWVTKNGTISCNNTQGCTTGISKTGTLGTFAEVGNR
jgi:hypothetical protein